MLHLPCLLDRLDAGVDVVEPGELAKETDQALRTAGLIAPAAWADEIVCPACQATRLEVVQRAESASGRPQAWVACPECGRIPVDATQLDRERVDLDALAAYLAIALGCGGAVQPLVPDYLWLLGSCTVGVERCTLVLLRTPPDRDDRALLGHPGLRAHPRAVLLTVGAPAAHRDLPQPPPRILPLAALLATTSSVLTVDDAPLTALIAGDGRHRAPATIDAIPVPAGTRWEDIAITVMDCHLVAAVGPARYQRDARQAGCIDRGTGLPDGQWMTLRLLAQGLGTHRVPERRVSAALTKRMARLRAILRALFPAVTGDPVPFDDDTRSFCTAFSLHTAGGQVFTLPSTGWDGVTLVWAGHGRLGVEVVAEQRQSVGSHGADPNDTVEIAVGTAYARQLVELTSVGLADAAGHPNRSGRTLERLCRSNGMLPGRGDDDAVLELAQDLRRLFGTTRDPLQWDEQPQRWTAICDVRLAPGA